MPWALVGGLATALIAVLTWPRSALSGSAPSALGQAAAASNSAPKGVAVAVVFTLNDYDTAANGCIGQGGYGDIGPGTPVTLKDEAGTVLAAGSLGSGAGLGGSCTWHVSLSNVPADRSFYSAEVDRRGAITESQADLKAASYTFELSLGS